MSASAPTHVTETLSDRKKSRELAEARQSGAVAPEVDVKTGAMINPHNPEFITRRPWYLGGNDAGPSLDHQADQRAESERIGLSLSSADKLVREQRENLKKARRANEFRVGMWIEALKHNRKPYLICQIIKIAKNGTEYDLKYEDGTIERKVKFRPGDAAAAAARKKTNPRMRMTKTGSRSFRVDHEKFGKETYDSKRDAYHGYDVAGTHMKRLEEKYSTKDALRRKKRLEAQKHSDGSDGSGGEKKDDKTGQMNGRGGEGGKGKKDKDRHTDSDSDTDYDSDIGSDSEDEFVQKDEESKIFTSRMARQGGVGGAQMKVTARNLRIREDTAKYLRNLDPNSAYYDPKSRSMRDNPNPDVNPEELQFAGDNFTRISGDAIGLAQTQVFAWEAAEKAGVPVDLHPQADPSQAELLRKQFTTKSADLKIQRKRAVLDKYGGAEYLDGGDGLGGAANTRGEKNDSNADAETAEERKVRFGVSVSQELYTRDGRLIKGGAAVKREALKSKYEEDVFINGHTTVWGSYFHKGAFRWGYADDHSLMRNSYCTGLNGRKANDEANEMRYGTGVAGSAALAQAREMLKAIPKSERTDRGDASRPTSSRLYGEADQNAAFDKNKLDVALKKVDDHRRRESSSDGKDERKRKYNSMNADVDVTEEEMEAYRLRKERTDDPMAKLHDSDEVLEYK